MIGAALKESTFNRATFTSVSFVPRLALPDKYYPTVKADGFDSTTMDRLTHAVLKGMEVDLSKVTVI